MSWEPSARYPDPAVVVLDESFNRYRLPLAKVERLATGITRWAEGPVWLGDQRCLLWSDVPGDCMWRWDEAAKTGSHRCPDKPDHLSAAIRLARESGCHRSSRA